MVELKQSLGFGPLEEVKMNTRAVQELKIKLTDGVLSILRGCTGFISITEGEDKQKAAESISRQLFNYCNLNGVPAFMLNFDRDLVPRRREFEEFTKSQLAGNTVCIGVQHLSSSSD